jgi:hypothetical protein
MCCSSGVSYEVSTASGGIESVNDGGCDGGQWVWWVRLVPIVSTSHDNGGGTGPPVGPRVVPTTVGVVRTSHHTRMH